MKDRSGESLNTDGICIPEQAVRRQLNIVLDAFPFLIRPTKYRRIEGRLGSIGRHDLPQEHTMRRRRLGVGEGNRQADQQPADENLIDHDLELL
jgi:hypothetical protein